MPRTAVRGTFIRGRTTRVTRGDGCGRPVFGEYNQAISEGLVTVAITPNTVDTEEINVPNFAGKRCVYEPSVTSLAGYSLVLTFCNVDFEMFEILTGQTLVFDANGRVVGIEADTQIVLGDSGFTFESWTGAQGADACEDPDAEGQWGYLNLPRLVGGIIGDITIENAAINFTTTGASTREGNFWGSGPYAVDRNAEGEAAPLFQPISRTAALRMQIVTVAPPTEVVGARPVLDPALPALTSIAAVEGSTDMEADFTTTPASTGPVWYDFGDGEWDYVVAPGAASHLYDTAGTYTVKASQNGLDWAETTVTVPFAP